MSTKVNIAVVGATGAVGREMLDILAQRNFPHASIKALASPRSAGQMLPFGSSSVKVEATTLDSFKGIDIALFSAGSSISKEFCKPIAAFGCTTVDNSSAFRMDDSIPLTVPEVNADSLGPVNSSGKHALRNPDGSGRIIANPNCAAIILLVAMNPLKRAFGIEKLIVSTYQAASGAGAKALEELEDQTKRDLAGEEIKAGIHTGGVFHEPYAFNLFSHNTAIDPITGLNGEETKVILESRKIWNEPKLSLAVTCVRVPIRRAHAESVHVILKTPATTRQVREALLKAPGVKVVDDRTRNFFPTPLKASGTDEILVGRIRPAPCCIPPEEMVRLAGVHGHADDVPTKTFNLFICGDQLRKGAALNAIQIAEMLA